MKIALTEFNKTKDRGVCVFDGHAYIVWGTEIGLKVSDRTGVDGTPAYDLTFIGDEGHCDDGKTVAYEYFDTRKYFDEVQNREFLIDRLADNHFSEILNSFRSAMNNGVMEGLNSVIQAVRGCARGYKDRRNLRTMCYLCGSGFC